MTEVNSAELIFICFMLLHGFAAALNCTSPTPESLFGELEKDLFPKKLLRPVNSFSSPLNITISITVVGIIGVEEKSQSLTTLIWQVLEWNIEGLSWDDKECGTSRVSVPREKLWIPDVHIAEFMTEDKSPKTPYVYINNTGHVFDDKPITVISSCILNIYSFPFDIQNCSLTFGSYLHFNTDIRMVQGSSSEEILEESLEVSKTNGEWTLIGVHVNPDAQLVLSEGSYSEIKYYIILRRRPILYVVNLLIPSCFLITVDLFSFMLPPHSVDRSSFKMTLLLGYTVFLLIMNDLLPTTGETTPLINVFFSLSLALMVASLLETVLITYVHFSSSQYKKEKDFSFNNISAIHLQRAPGETPPEKQPVEPALEELRKLSRDLLAIRFQVDKHFQGSTSSQEWQMIGIVIDRLLFSLYLVFIIVSFIIIICIWIRSSYTV
ncbi:5-hydroxytryptamine receptor 3C [Dissostichus eleginoides]|uniref:5-hydroxytryptamine receptor 3C n=1 Tax=Dissostichus eleginoides TaxID=100907 RepID=A0AAD9CA14_DISEL|nr:5-hydroxytryptamine receptor 3C [Dissostichus eleginoides]